MKRFGLNFLAIGLFVNMIWILMGCRAMGFGTRSVSTFEELIDTSTTSNIKLMNDIDCNFETINGIRCDKFDGGGHTIKNFIMSGSDNVKLFRDCREIKNLTIENVKYSLKDGNASFGASILINYGTQAVIENVTVKNSTMEISFSKDYGNRPSYIGIGVIAAGCEKQYADKLTITNCNVENVKVEVTKSSLEQYDISLGGIIGGYGEVSLCKVKNSSLCANGSNHQSVYVGGIAGLNDSIKTSFVQKTILSSKNTWCDKWVLGFYSTPKVYAGGYSSF